LIADPDLQGHVSVDLTEHVARQDDVPRRGS
jgi:hypothetical protein